MVPLKYIIVTFSLLIVNLCYVFLINKSIPYLLCLVSSQLCIHRVGVYSLVFVMRALKFSEYSASTVG